jgi:RNA polymerase sigma-70 factor (ECF subfamily)
MRPKWIPVNKQALVEGCRKGDRKAQRYLYDQYNQMLFGVCRRYVKDTFAAEDVLVEAFYKIFTKIGQLTNPDQLESWMRRVAVNEALMWLRKRKKMKISDIDSVPEPSQEPKGLELLRENDLLKLLDELPEGYRTVFNLYVIEGYKHREIAEELGISINTSKSQLIMARRKLKEIIELRFDTDYFKRESHG